MRRLRAAFYRDVGYGFDSHRQFEPARHRAFLDRTGARIAGPSAALLALGIAETYPGAVMARFQSAVLVDAKHKLDKRVQITRLLQAAFPAPTSNWN